MIQIFGLLAGLLPLMGTFPYVRDIFRLKTKPHRGSFLIWAILGLIAIFSQAAEGASWSLLLPAADVVAVVIIFVLSIKRGVGGLNRRDIGALFLAALGLALWYITNQPLLALLIVIAVDAIGTTLTAIKTYAEPHTETLSAWLLSTLAGLCAAFAVGRLSFELLVYPLYAFVACGIVTAIIVMRRNKATPQTTPPNPELSPFIKDPPA